VGWTNAQRFRLGIDTCTPFGTAPLSARRINDRRVDFPPRPFSTGLAAIELIRDFALPRRDLEARSATRQSRSRRGGHCVEEFYTYWQYASAIILKRFLYQAFVASA